jgi:hypothetical protein
MAYLAKNPDMAEDIVQMTPARQGAALAKIAAKVSAPVIKPVSKAPEPIKSVGGGAKATGAPGTDPDKMTMAEFATWQDAQDRKRRNARLGR